MFGAYDFQKRVSGSAGSLSQTLAWLHQKPETKLCFVRGRAHYVVDRFYTVLFNKSLEHIQSISKYSISTYAALHREW